MSKKMPYDTAIGIVSDTFRAEIDSTSDRTALKSKIVDAQRSIRQIQDNEADDAQLTAAREIVKDLGKGYREATKNEVAKIVVALQRLEELGDG
jgi:hypothetical protein